MRINQLREQGGERRTNAGEYTSRSDLLNPLAKTLSRRIHAGTALRLRGLEILASLQVALTRE